MLLCSIWEKYVFVAEEWCIASLKAFEFSCGLVFKWLTNHRIGEWKREKNSEFWSMSNIYWIELWCVGRRFQIIIIIIIITVIKAYILFTCFWLIRSSCVMMILVVLVWISNINNNDGYSSETMRSPLEEVGVCLYIRLYFRLFLSWSIYLIIWFLVLPSPL